MKIVRVEGSVLGVFNLENYCPSDNVVSDHVRPYLVKGYGGNGKNQYSVRKISRLIICPKTIRDSSQVPIDSIIG